MLHHHPQFGTIWAAAGRVPPPYEQMGAMLPDEDIAIFDEYVGSVADAANAKANVAAVGSARCALLAGHGVLVSGEDVRQAHFFATALETRCARAWHVEAIGGGLPPNPEGRQGLIDYARSMNYHLNNFWEYSVRQELRADPGLLD